MSNLCINCDKYPANYCVIFDGSEVISVFNFVVGYLRVMRVVRLLGELHETANNGYGNIIHPHCGHGGCWSSG